MFVLFLFLYRDLLLFLENMRDTCVFRRFVVLLIGLVKSAVRLIFLLYTRNGLYLSIISLLYRVRLEPIHRPPITQKMRSDLVLRQQDQTVADRTPEVASVRVDGRCKGSTPKHL